MSCTIPVRMRDVDASDGDWGKRGEVQLTSLPLTSILFALLEEVERSSKRKERDGGSGVMHPNNSSFASDERNGGCDFYLFITRTLDEVGTKG